MLRKHTLDAGWGQFLQILEYVCWKRGVYFARVDARVTSQTCPQCGTHTGKKTLAERVHKCDECGYETDRDVAAAQVVMQRGLVAVAQSFVGGFPKARKLCKKGIPWQSLLRVKCNVLPLMQESPGFRQPSVAKLS